MSSRRTVSARPLALLAAAGVVLAAGSAVAASNDLASSSASVHLVQVPGLLLGLSKAERLSDAPAGQTLTLGVGLARPNPAGEQALLTAMTTKGNPLYRQFMTPAQFEAKFGVAAATVSAAKAWLTSTGASIETASPTGDYLTVKATVKQADALLHVTEGIYHDAADHSTFYANSSAPLVPSNLPVTGVTGLDSEHKFATASLTNPTAASAAAAYKKASAAANPAAAAAKPADAAAKPADAAATTGDSPTNLRFDQLLYPRDLWKLYNQPSANLGQGETMGVFGEGETDSVIENLRFFEQSQGLPKIPVRVIRTEPGQETDYGDNAGAVEWYLDTQAETGMAPDATRLDLYFAKTLFDADIAQDFSSWVTDPQGPTQMNASFGECEQDPSNPVTGPLAQTPYGTELGDELEAVAEPILEEANLEGRTLFSSAGDTGSGCPEVVVPVGGAANGLAVQPVPIVEYPSDSAYATGVGGTVLMKNADGTRNAERSWQFSGGGASHFLVEPSYQKVATQNDLPCVSSPDGSPAATGQVCRGNPDVAALSGNATFGNAYFIYVEGAASSEGGTSLSSPLWVGMWTRIQAAAPAGKFADGGLGPAMNALYSKYDGNGAGGGASPHYSADFYDITASETGAGSIDDPGSSVAPGVLPTTINAGTGNGAYQPTTGWDYASGLGSPNVTNLMMDLDGRVTPTNGLGYTPKYTAGGYPESPSTLVCTAVENSPAGNAINPAEASLGDVGQADLTRLTFTTSPDGKTITAVLAGTNITGSPNSGALGIVYQVYWQYAGQSYFVKYDIEATGDTLTDGKAAAANGVAEVDTASPKATATVADNAITFSIPTSEVGSPPVGAVLNVPAAFSQVSPAGELALTADSASAASYDTASVGQEVENGHVCPAAAPAPISASPKPAKATSCTARTSSIKVYGHTSTVLNKFGQASFTFKLFINAGRCKTPSPVGRQFYVFVDGHRSAVLRTGRGGVQIYLVRLRRGPHKVTASFPGNRDLKKSASAMFKLKVV